ncbi:histone-lysine N-methyltransferase family member SUVH9-like [Alnus glutinosa]|jgi:euchromatic histone-lysine N-methyltransferase|uniref:histone-lysine N-methyltransferase family member SUVH9-like n=1 Tax=Alnus glutinosa TaxID=3517 RepID=UPI002D78BB67|nr:histone-lysine N-methyltransferase family member SUVH9-like [Alnus glutinosa]XP_062166900.1 histone-lysine N-methyltransferase family member SUVH9-like [Alnus glutinosa]XP_062166904.1 histone-lysine N-methyltransferase family member SUVH9-like [Alnus glutinosa]
MGSLIPFQDLNVLPDPPTTTTAMLTPKIEPKLEPLDEPLENLQPTPQQQHLQQTSQGSFFSSTTPDNYSNSENAPQPSGISSSEDNVYSEFFRVSELFRSAFAKRLQSYGDVIDPDSRAIVPVPQDSNALESINHNSNNQVSNDVVSRRRSHHQRSGELVRVTDLGMEDQRYFRDVVRRTRMIYDSLRVFSMMEDEKRRLGDPGLSRRLRGDLRAASVMRDRGLWLNRDKRIVGSIPGVYIGDLFFFRMELCVVGLHGQAQAGIDYVPVSQSSNGEPIATSIIVSGGYEDDEDAGDVIVYTGHGGQDKFSKQCVHQKLEGGNLALERSMHYGIEVRVIRGIKYEGGVTSKVYVYDGLYRIFDCWFDVGKSGFGVYKYKLVRIDGQAEMGSAVMRFAQSLRTSPLAARPVGYLSLDISMKKENVPVLLFNDIDADQEPMYYDYLVKTVFPPFAFHQTGNGTGCDCVSGCVDDCFCAIKNGGEFSYDHNGILVRGKPLVFECGPFCRCPPSCRNRVTQKGLRNRLEVFRSRETGWGVRSLDLIQAGAFICEYAGVVLTRDQAQIFSMNGDTLIYPNRFSSRWAEWGDLSQIFTDYVRPSYPLVPPLDFAMDVSRMRNVACYISHSTTPNVLVQFVLYDHNNLMFPHLMLFAMENIPPLRELSLDYGVADEWTGKLSICN